MNRNRSRFAFVTAALVVASAAAAGATVLRATAQQGAQVGAQVGAQRTRIAFDRALPPMDGKQLVMKIVDVRYGPGESSAAHRHGCAVVVFVIDGAVRMSVRGGRDSVYTRGQTFHETPTDVHQTSANASASDSAHFTATFVCDHEGPLSTPAP